LSVATINTKATASALHLTDEDVDLTFADIVEAGFTPPPNPNVDLSASVQIPEIKIEPDIYVNLGTGGYTLADAVDALAEANVKLAAISDQIIASITYEARRTMTPQCKETLVTALRTTRFRQIRGNYTDHADGRCAIGVLMEAVYGEVSTAAVSKLYSMGIDCWFGCKIASMNDSGSTFAKIADWIDATC